MKRSRLALKMSVHKGVCQSTLHRSSGTVVYSERSQSFNAKNRETKRYSSPNAHSSSLGRGKVNPVSVTKRCELSKQKMSYLKLTVTTTDLSSMRLSIAVNLEISGIPVKLSLVYECRTNQLQVKIKWTH